MTQAKQGLAVLVASVITCSPGFVFANDSRTVDCSRGGSIVEVLERSDRGRPLTLAVLGTCREGVTITRDDVSLVGDAATSTILGSVTIDGGRRALIEGVSITNPAGNGVTVINGGSATLRNNHISDSSGYGLIVRNGSFAVVNDNFLERNGVVNQTDVDASGIAVAQGSTVRAARNQFRDNANAGIEVFDNSFYRSEGDAIVMRTAAPAGRSAVDTFRNGLVDLRGVSVTGNVFVNQQSQLQARNLEGPTGTSTFTGNIGVSVLSFLRLRAGVVRQQSTLSCGGGFSVCQCDGFAACPVAVP